MLWAWEQDLVAALPRFPKLKPQRDAAGTLLTKSELNALYFATHYMKRPRGWSHPLPDSDRCWKCALVVFFNYGVDAGLFGRHCHFTSPILLAACVVGNGNRRTVRSEHSPWGSLFLPAGENRQNVLAANEPHGAVRLKSIMPDSPDPNAPVCFGGGTRPNNRFRVLCDLAGIQPKTR